MTAVLIALGVVVMLVLLHHLFGGSTRVDRRVRDAAETGDLAPVLAQIEGLPPAKQPAVFDQAIKQLWDGFQRELAARLVRELAARHKESRIAQYWLDQVQKVEPEVAREVLDAAFLAEHYDAEIAATCGRFG